MPKANPDQRTMPPLTELFKPIYVLQMNWWHLSDENRVKWLLRMRTACLRTANDIDQTIKRVRNR